VSWGKLAEGFGAKAFVAETMGEFKIAFARALLTPGPVVIEASLQ
jgi:thiamine pyrophosphate-dependent acetolactate synthase large subunit-like protein